jgi:hypothetical protein
MTSYRANLLENKVAVFLTFTGLAFIIFSSSTGRIFLSDDYCTINNIARNNVLMPSFFRPVGDITLKWNYYFAGADPFYFYVTNIFLHALNSFLLYVFCMRWFIGTEKRWLYAFITGLLFLTYPSHSEAILWTIGRGISLAVTFSLLAMIFYVSYNRSWFRYVLVAIAYFIALASYESVLLLPIILFALSRRETKKQNTIFAIVLVATLLLHASLRFYLAGGIWRAYNGEIFSKDIIEYLSAFVKMVLRLFMPPFDKPLLFAACAAALIMLTGFFVYRNRRKIQTDVLVAKTVVVACIGIFATLLVAMMFGVSTRTSEGDRLLYFPSVFVCLLISLFVVSFAKNRSRLIVIGATVLLFQLLFLLKNQSQWNSASDKAVNIINKVAKTPSRPLYLINLPSDYNGAYIFRNCFREALFQYHIDTTGINIVNVLRSNEQDIHHGAIEAQRNGDEIFIWPTVVVESGGERGISVNGQRVFSTTGGATILYWNGIELKNLQQ